MGPITLGALVVVAVVGMQEGPDPDRLYGRVVTAGGEVYQGTIRWDRNEGSWADVLNGSKELPWENERDAERLDARWRREDREHSVRFLGLRISWSGDERRFPTSATSGVRFGHIRSLEVVDDDRALLTLKSGQEIALEGGSTDIGDPLRGLVVDDPARGEVELRWRDLDVVEFMAPPGEAVSGARRLHGTLRTRRGLEFTGYVAWDADEILSSDVLDGEERGRDRKIPFERIAVIERAGPSAARVVLVDGEEMVLSGSNDVDASNRGIAVSDPGLGQVTVDWDSFEELVLHEPPAGGDGYDRFDGGRPLWGTVEAEDGSSHTGWIRWDNDEEYTWEILDGRLEGLDLDVEMGLVSSIRALGSRGSLVTLRDGRRFELEGSNDVDAGNKGIFVTREDGEVVLVRWDDLREVVFESP